MVTDVLANCIQQGAAYLKQGLYKEAMLTVERYLKFDRLDCNALYIWSRAASYLGLYDDADEVAGKIIEQDGNHVGAYIVRSYCAQQQHRLLEQEKWFLAGFAKLDQAPQWQPFAVDLYILAASYYSELAETEKAWRLYTAAASIETNIYRVADFSNAVLTMNYLDMEIADELNFSKKYDDYFINIKRFTHNKAKHKHNKLRIGYISPDFRAGHPVMVFAWSMMKYFNSDDFEVYVYQTWKGFDKYTWKYFPKLTKCMTLQGQSPETVAKEIYNDEIDILFDLSGHSSMSALPVLAYRPAPIQMTGIGHISSTGLSEVDYFLTDSYTAPAGSKVDQQFTERLVRMPASHICYSQPEFKQMPSIRSELPYKKNGYITFASVNKTDKITHRILTLWKRILHNVPNSILILRGKMFDVSEGRNIFLTKLRALDMPIDRIKLVGYSQNYLQEYSEEIDIMLDTSPYQGMTTTCEVLYMGIPVVSLQGGKFRERIGSSILHNIGVGELVAGSEDEYVAIAAALANNTDVLDVLHDGLRTLMQKSPLMDGRGYVKNLEQTYKEIWRQYCSEV